MRDIDTIDLQIQQADARRITKQGEAELEQIDGMRMAQDQFTDHMASFHQLVGRSQALTAIREITNVLDFSQLAQFKDSKGYRAWKGKKTPNGSMFSGKWDDFCTEFLGKSVITIDAGIDNVKSFGPDAVDGMQRLGISARKFAELRRLPEDERSALAEAVQSGDKDTFLDLAESLIARHAKEKTALQSEIEAARQHEKTLHESLEATNDLMAKKDARFNALDKELHLRSGRSLPWHEQIAPLKDEMNMISSVLDEALGKMLIMHQAILGIDLDDDVRDVARRSLVTRHCEVLDRAAVLVAECQGQFDLELCGYIGGMRDFIMQVPGEDLPEQEAAGGQ